MAIAFSSLTVSAQSGENHYNTDDKLKLFGVGIGLGSDYGVYSGSSATPLIDVFYEQEVYRFDNLGTLTAGGTLGISRKTDATIAWQAMAQSGVFSDGFQITGSPQTQARAAFQAQTAIGKLNAVITPIGPSGCHCSDNRCCGRSLAIVNPCNCRLSPTAKSQMSITS